MSGTKLSKAALKTWTAEKLKTFDAKGRKLGKSFSFHGSALTKVKVDLGSLSASMMSALAGQEIPEVDRQASVLAKLEEWGVVGFNWKTVEDWRKAAESYAVLPREIREDFTIYALRDLATIPNAPGPDHKLVKTGGRVKVAQAIHAAGLKTDDAQRKAVKAAKVKATGGPSTPQVKTTEVLVKVIADRLTKAGGGPTAPTFTPDEDGNIVLTFDDVIAVAMYAQGVRDVAGSHDAIAYRTFFTGRLYSGPVANENDGSGAADTVDVDAVLAEAVA